MPALIDDIRGANRNVMEHFKRCDAAGLVRAYTPDATLLPPDSEMRNGPEAIRVFWQGAMDMGMRDVVLETVSVEARGDLAYEVGKYSLAMRPAGSPPANVAGKYVVVWKKSDGAWKMHVDIWNAGAA